MTLGFLCVGSPLGVDLRPVAAGRPHQSGMAPSKRAQNVSSLQACSKRRPETAALFHVHGCIFFSGTTLVGSPSQPDPARLSLIVAVQLRILSRFFGELDIEIAIALLVT